jgi:hypothetical protein
MAAFGADLGLFLWLISITQGWRLRMTRTEQFPEKTGK